MVFALPGIMISRGNFLRLALLCTVLVGSGAGRARAQQPFEDRGDSRPAFLQRVGRDLAAPLHGDSPWILGGGAALTVLSLRTEDAPTNRRSLDASAFDGLFDVGNEFGGGIVLGSLALGGWAAGSLTDHPGLSDFGLDLGSALLAVSAYTWTLKTALDRPRPNGGAHSFPSGHTAAAFAAATVIERHGGRLLGFAGYALAAATAGGRMEENRHYLSDVVFGAALGLGVGGAALPRVDASWLRQHFTVGRSGLAFRGQF